MSELTKAQQYQKQYRLDNKEKKQEYSKTYDKEYRQKNKERIRIRNNQKFNCDCGGRYTYTSKYLHVRTKKHQTYLTSHKKTK